MQQVDFDELYGNQEQVFYVYKRADSFMQEFFMLYFEKSGADRKTVCTVSHFFSIQKHRRITGQARWIGGET